MGKTSSFADLIAASLVRGMNILFNLMPVSFNIGFGRVVGGVMYAFSGRRARVTYANLKAAFCGEKSTEELRRLAREVYRSAGATFAELMCMTKMNKRYVDEHINVVNMERIEKAARNPNGMILVSAHFGNWELSTYTSVAKGFPLYMLARDQKMERLNELLNRLRESKGNIVIRKGLDVKNIFRLLRNGKSIGLLADQNAGANGQLIDLFGRPASTATGPYRFAQKTGAWILPAFIHRKNGPYHDLVLEEPMVIGEHEDIIPYMEKYNALLEKHVRMSPGHWFWMHKRWKVTPLKKVLVLDDGKKGHYKQSMSVVKLIRKYRADEGFRPEHLEVRTLQVSFRTKYLKGLLNVVAPFVTYHKGLHLKLLKMCVTEESYNSLVNIYADVIVSCGSTLSGVNRILKIENMARSVVILDPGKLARKKYDLVIVPRHDLNVKEKIEKNVIVTDLAPNLMDPKELESLRKDLTDANGRKGFTLGVLVGGGNAAFSFGEEFSSKIASAIEALCRRANVRVCMTTSRRTPDGTEKIFEEKLKGKDYCSMYVSGKTDTDERTVEKIVAISDLVLVSGDSISMVSESVSSGKPVGVFMPEKKVGRVTKYEKFVENLSRKGLVRVLDADGIKNLNVVGTQGKTRETEDTKRIYEKLHKLF